MKGYRTYMIGCGIILVLYLMAQYYKPTPTNWKPTYLKEDKIPYGLYILNNELQQLFPGSTTITSNQRVYNTLKDKDYKNTNYLIIANKVGLDDVDLKELIGFIEKGNHVLIAAYDIGEALEKKLKLKSLSSFYELNQRPTIHFVNPALDSAHQYHLQKGLGGHYFTELDTARAVSLGQNSRGKTNFVKYSFGKGAMYVLPDPQLLTNFNLIDPEGASYAAKILSHLPVSKTLIWDENNTRGNAMDGSYLRVIFSHPSLAWAYNLALIGLLVFVLFEMKRRQRVIPILRPLKNSTVEFVNVVGKVYYQKRDNRDITLKKITYFLEQLRTSYHLKTIEIDDEFAAALAIKSGVSEETIGELLQLITEIKNKSSVKDLELINLNKLIEKFYKQAY